MERINNNIYARRGKKFIPVGVHFDREYLTDGIWYVRHHDGCQSMTNLNYIDSLFKIADTPTPPEIEALCGLTEYCDYVTNNEEFRELTKGSYTLQEFVSKIIALVFDFNQKRLQNTEDNK